MHLLLQWWCPVWQLKGVWLFQSDQWHGCYLLTRPSFYVRTPCSHMWGRAKGLLTGHKTHICWGPCWQDSALRWGCAHRGIFLVPRRLLHFSWTETQPQLEIALAHQTYLPDQCYHSCTLHSRPYKWFSTLGLPELLPPSQWPPLLSHAFLQHSSQSWSR